MRRPGGRSALTLVAAPLMVPQGKRGVVDGAETGGKAEEAEPEALDALERALLVGAEEDARQALRRYLSGSSGAPVEGSLGDVVAALAASPQGRGDEAAVLLRALSVPGVVRANQANNLARSIVELVAVALPSVAEFAHVSLRRQTYESFAALEKVHAEIVARLEPLRVAYTSAETLLAARATIMGSLRHPLVRSYLRPWRVAEVAEAVDAMIARVDRIRRMESTLADDVDGCHAEIRSRREQAARHPTFLATEHLGLFMENVGRIVDALLAGARGRFRTALDLATSGPEQQKRQPLHEPGRRLRIDVPMRASGPGDALGVVVRVGSSSDHVLVDDGEIPMGDLRPGVFSFPVEAEVVDPCASLSIDLQVTWRELGDVQPREEIFEVRILAQRPDVDWARYVYSNPYAEAPAGRDRFIGRREQVQAVVARVLQDPMEPAYIDGQKRVGKTSLAQVAVAEAALQAGDRRLHRLYLLWGNLAAEDSRATLRSLGSEIEEFILNALPDRESYPRGDYAGTLAPLLKLSGMVAEREPDRRFVVIVDEFDDMSQDLYLQGTLAEVFFANIRAITATPNLCLLLVGSENMPYVMDRQGQKLNRFSRINLNYFSRGDEWADFEEIVRRPSEGVLHWHQDAINEIFAYSGGNPYFAKILCRGVMARAVRERDADVTAAEVRSVADEIIPRLEANQFAHLWQDGIHSPLEERETVALDRRRVLAAMARCLREGERLTLAGVAARRIGARPPEAELASVMNSFVARDVLVESGGEYEFRLPMFRMWLEGVGLSRLADDRLAEDLAVLGLRLDEEARVGSDEIVALTREWAPYRDDRIGEERVRAWLDQVSSPREQRLLFTLLKSVRVISLESNLRRLRTAGQIIRDEIGTPPRRNLAQRRHDVVVTYVDGEGKSGQRYASDFAEENKVSTKAILPPSRFSAAFAEFTSKIAKGAVPKAIVIIDDVVATGGSLSRNVARFVKANAALLEETRPLVLVHALFATEQGADRVRTSLEALDYDRIDFRAGEFLTEDDFAFAGDVGVFGTPAERDRARALAIDIGSRIYLDGDPLGFGGQGLLLVLPMTVPNNTLPILHSAAKVGNPWWPLFERPVN